MNIKGVMLDKEQLKNYLENLASDHTLVDHSSKETYPMPEIEKDFEYITNTYELLNSHLKLGITIHQAGEWLLDNYYIIEETVHELRKNMPLKKYKEFIGIGNGKYRGYARAYVLAMEIVELTDANFKAKDLEEYLKSYQNKKTLNMEEIWDINLFFKIALIQRIKEVCVRIYISQIQKIKVENIIERLVENKPKDEIKFKISSNEYAKILQSHGEDKYTFIEYMSYKLKKYGKKAISYLNILEEEINKRGLTLQEVTKKEHYDVALKKVTIGNSIKSIHLIQRMNFLSIFEKINGVEEILKQDPSGIYPKMEYKTKECYRNKIKEISKKTKISEIYIAKKAAHLAETENENKKKSHVGYYLISDGVHELYQALGVKKKAEHQIEKKKINIYIYGITCTSLILSIMCGILIFYNTNNVSFGLIEAFILFIPIFEIITKIVQNVLGRVVKPKLIPKLDFSEGIPESDTTMVIIPTIIASEEEVKKLVKKIEVFYLANESENIYFTILGDCTKEEKETIAEDRKIEECGKLEIENLNKKYTKNGLPRFNFIYRRRMWNKQEKCYLGWERKRGLITELNNYLINGKTDIEDIFLVNTLEEYKRKNKAENFPKIKYVITLDADTNLTLNSGIELIEAMAHPLNEPELSKEKNKVVNGYGIMQPRIGIDLETSSISIFTQIFAGSGGVDSYTNAISDVYQDNFSEGIFTGKGIYDLEVFHKVMKGKIPENTVLSHDLLEGSYLRCGLVTDIMLLDGYPSRI